MNNEENKGIVCHKCGHNFGELNEEILVLCPDCKEIMSLNENEAVC